MRLAARESLSEDLSKGREPGSAALQARHNQRSIGSPGVDQLLGGETRPRMQVGEVTFHCARPNVQEPGCAGDGSSGNEGGKDVHLALRCGPRERTAQVAIL